MPSYKNLAIVALAASSVSPALSAPTRYVNVYLRVRGPPDGPIPLDRVGSSLEANLKNERTRSYWSVWRLILRCARYRPFLRDRLAAAQNARPRLPRVGQLPSWRGAELFLTLGYCSGSGDGSFNRGRGLWYVSCRRGCAWQICPEGPPRCLVSVSHFHFRPSFFSASSFDCIVVQRR